MAHPYAEHRAHKVEKSRVSHIAHRAAGGAVTASGEAGPKARRASGGAVKAPAQRMSGGAVKYRADKRARGGRTKHKGTTINIVNAGHPNAPPMAGLGAAPPMAMPPRAPALSPPMGAPAPGAGPPMPPAPGALPIRSQGGRAYKKGGAVAGANKSGRAWMEGVRDGTQPKNSPGKDDGKDIGIKTPTIMTEPRRKVTFWVGGAVKKRAKGGRIESPQGVDKHTDLPGGSGGGEARLVKEKRARREFHPKNRLES